MTEDFSKKYKLVEVLPSSSHYIRTLYDWSCNEKHSEYYTCRPVKKMLDYDEYTVFIKNHVEKGIRFYALESKDKTNFQIYGKITMFDHNSRNHSAEFGYYLPEHNRKQGFGKIMIQLFLEDIFNDEVLDLNKLYATTSSNNIASIKILEQHNFTLDGRLREHYWIDNYIYDQLHYSILKKEWLVR